MFLIALAATWLADGRTSHAILVEEPTLSEIIADREVVVLCRIIGGKSAVVVSDLDEYEMEVIEVLKGDEALKSHPGAKSPYRFQTSLWTDKPADSVYFTTALKAKKLFWYSATPVDEREQKYLRALAKPAANSLERVKALVPFLDATEKFIAEDLSRELYERFSYREIRQAASELPVAKLRAWIADSKTTSDRRSLYLYLLSVCGTRDDLPLVKTFVFSNSERDRYDLSMAIACYLIFGGEASLSSVEETFFKDPKDVGSSGRTSSAVWAFSFVARETDLFPRERQLSIYRPLLPVLEGPREVVTELTRLEDWHSTAQIIELSRTAYDGPREHNLKIAIARFLRRSPKPEAKVRLEELTKLDPRTVKESEKEQTP